MTPGHQCCPQGAKLLHLLKKVMERKTEGGLSPENTWAASAEDRRKGLRSKSVLLKETDSLLVT